MRRQLVLSLAAVLVFIVAPFLQGTATTDEKVAIVGRASQSLGDPRIDAAVDACLKAWAGKAGIRGYGAVVDALHNDQLGLMRGAIVALQDGAFREAYNTFVQIPVCAALVADLGINPNQLSDCATGQRLTFNADNESSSCQPTDYSAFDLSGSFLGSWTGQITQQNPPNPPSTLTVLILQGKVGSTVASGFYTGDNCRVHWTLLSAEPNRIVVNEVVHSGTCFNNIKITLTAQREDTLGYDFENGNGQGTLKH